MQFKPRTRVTIVLSGDITAKDASTASAVVSVSGSVYLGKAVESVMINPFTLPAVSHEVQNDFLYYLNKKLSGEYSAEQSKTSAEGIVTS